MKNCPKCKSKIDPAEIYGDWFYCFNCNRNFPYKSEDDCNSKDKLKNNPFIKDSRECFIDEM